MNIKPRDSSSLSKIQELRRRMYSLELKRKVRKSFIDKMEIQKKINGIKGLLKRLINKKK